MTRHICDESALDRRDGEGDIQVGKDETLNQNKFMKIAKQLGLAVAALLLTAVAPVASAEQPSTHHFFIVRPATPVIAGTPVEIEITARLQNNKINKKGAHNLVIQTTSGQGGHPRTISTELGMKRGQARLTMTFNDAGPAILQVSDKADAALSNSASISVMPVPAKREARQ
jgi:hypothetical protein